MTDSVTDSAYGNFMARRNADGTVTVDQADQHILVASEFMENHFGGGARLVLEMTSDIRYLITGRRSDGTWTAERVP